MTLNDRPYNDLYEGTAEIYSFDRDICCHFKVDGGPPTGQLFGFTIEYKKDGDTEWTRDKYNEKKKSSVDTDGDMGIIKTINEWRFFKWSPIYNNTHFRVTFYDLDTGAMIAQNQIYRK